MSLGCVCLGELQTRFLGFVQLVVATGTVRSSSFVGFCTETKITLRGKRERKDVTNAYTYTWAKVTLFLVGEIILMYMQVCTN